eukprot:3324039-Pyramimonas_sp.AAC.1
MAVMHGVTDATVSGDDAVISTGSAASAATGGSEQQGATPSKKLRISPPVSRISPPPNSDSE